MTSELKERRGTRIRKRAKSRGMGGGGEGSPSEGPPWSKPLLTWAALAAADPRPLFPKVPVTRPSHSLPSHEACWQRPARPRRKPHPEDMLSDPALYSCVLNRNQDSPDTSEAWRASGSNHGGWTKRLTPPGTGSTGSTREYKNPVRVLRCQKGFNFCKARYMSLQRTQQWDPEVENEEGKPKWCRRWSHEGHYLFNISLIKDIY